MKLLAISITLALVVADGLCTHSWAAQEKKESPGKPAPKDDDLPPPPPPLPKPEPMPEIPHLAPDNRDKLLGKYLDLAGKQMSVVLASPVGKAAWQQLKPGQFVKAGQTYVALPGCRGDFQLQRLKLTLWGNMPEILPFPPLLESIVDMHQHDVFAADFTLRAGRVVLGAEADKVMVRVRFENPNLPAHFESIDMILHGAGTQVLLDRGGRLRPGKPFCSDPKDPKREPLGAFLVIWVLKGTVSVRHDTDSHWLSAPPGLAKLVWNSLQGLKMPEEIKELPPAVSLDPPPPEGLDKDQQKLRDEILKARADLAGQPASKPINLRLTLAARSADVGRRILALRCYAAIGAAGVLTERLHDERDPVVWHECIVSLKHWMGVSRDNEYKVQEQLRKRYSGVEADKIMELLHVFPSPDTLVEYLDNPLLIIRQLAHMDLCEVVPKGKAIPYDPQGEPAPRMAAQRAWTKLLHQ